MRSKATAFWQVANYREAYGLFACTGILANHESPLRPNRFVTQKIIQGVKAIAEGKQQKLVLGNLDIWRDWGWAPEYVEAMYGMLQAETPMDFLIASGKTNSLRELVAAACRAAELKAEERVEACDDLFRPTDLTYSGMDPRLIEEKLGWKSSHTLEEIILKMHNGILF